MSNSIALHLLDTSSIVDPEQWMRVEILAFFYNAKDCIYIVSRICGMDCGPRTLPSQSSKANPLSRRMAF